MNILHVIDHHWRYNGMVHAAVDLACAQAALGHRVAFATSDQGSFSTLLAEHDVEVYQLTHTSGKLGAVPFAFGLNRVVLKFKPDLMHAHMTKSAVLASTISRLRGIPLVTCVQNSFSRFAGLMRVGDRVITGCKAVAEDMAKRGVPRAKLRPILNGTIGSVRQSVQAETAPEIHFNHPAVITFCGMHWRKGVPDLIAGVELARKINPQIHLYLFGEGPNLEEYKAMVKPADKDHIIFCEPVPNAKPYLEAADVFVLASVADPAPLVICEAREAGCAIIGTQVDGIPELLENGRAGILVKPRSAEQIAEHLTYLFSAPQNLARWRQKSQYQIDRLQVSRVAAESVEVYEEVARARSGDATVSKAEKLTSAAW